MVCGGSGRSVFFVLFFFVPFFLLLCCSVMFCFVRFSIVCVFFVDVLGCFFVWFRLFGLGGINSGCGVSLLD